MILPVIGLILVFNYIPMYGIIIAFQDYLPGDPFWGEGTIWVGFDNFIRFMQSEFFWRLIRNTLVLSALMLLFGFPAPIIFALMIDQLRHLRFKKLIQTVSYMPYFISWVIVVGMVVAFIDINGLVSNILAEFGVIPRNLRNVPVAFPIIYTVTNIWKGFGFGSILYVATLSAIDPGLYESAKIDGANRLHQVWYISLPGIKHVIMIHLILSIGGLLSANTEFILLLYTPATYIVADVLGTYTFRMGILGGQFSMAATVGLFSSAIGFCLVFIANKLSNKVTGFGFW